MATKKSKVPTGTDQAAATQKPGVQEAPAEPFIPGPLGMQKFEFLTEPKSPFKDGYSIAAEEKFLAEFMAGPMNERDPLYDRYIELEDRKDQLVTLKEKYDNMRGAPGVITREEAIGMDELGSLADEEVDQMLIHTKEGYRMFMGRARPPGTDVAPIVGGRQVASALRALWLMTGDNNPYADWALLRHEQTVKEIAKRIKRATEGAEQVIADQRRKGLTYSILQSINPKAINLGFRSPYGYAITSLIADFDYFVRLQKTLARKNLRTDDEARLEIVHVTRFMRRVFNETTRFWRWLTKPEVKPLSRADFLPSADADALKRVEFASGVFGVVPGAVFAAQLQPRHSRRHQQVTAEERRLLEQVAARLDAGQAASQKVVAAAPTPEAAATANAQESDAGKK